MCAVTVLKICMSRSKGARVIGVPHTPVSVLDGSVPSRLLYLVGQHSTWLGSYCHRQCRMPDLG